LIFFAVKHLKDKYPPASIHCKAIAQRFIQRALPPVGENPVFYGVLQPFGGNGLLPDGKQGDLFPRKAIESSS